MQSQVNRSQAQRPHQLLSLYRKKARETEKGGERLLTADVFHTEQVFIIMCPLRAPSHQLRANLDKSHLRMSCL